MSALDSVGALLGLLALVWAFALGFYFGRRSCPPPANGNGHDGEAEDKPVVKVAL